MITTEMIFCVIDVLLAQQVRDLTENIEQLRTKSQEASQNTLNFDELQKLPEQEIDFIRSSGRAQSRETLVSQKLPEQELSRIGSFDRNRTLDSQEPFILLVPEQDESPARREEREPRRPVTRSRSKSTGREERETRRPVTRSRSKSTGREERELRWPVARSQSKSTGR